MVALLETASPKRSPLTTVARIDRPRSRRHVHTERRRCRLADSVNVTVDDAGFIPALAVAGNHRVAYRLAKRVFDVAGAVVLLVLLAPILLTLLLVLTITTKGHPIFVQVRVGERGRRFRMYKFRSMRLNAAKMQHLVHNEKDGPIFKNRMDPRVTRIGRFLRRTSLDETPQLINVLLGHMSLVGPRPPVPEEVARYKPWQVERLAVKPGLTCLWQVSGRSEIGFEEWVRMDIRYIRQQSLKADLHLLARTPAAVLSRRGAY